MRFPIDLSAAVMAPFADDAPRPRRVKAAAPPQPAWVTRVTPALLPAAAPPRGASANNTQRAVDALPSGSATTETLPPLSLLELPQVEEAGALAPLGLILSDGTVAAHVAASGLDADSKARLLARLNAATKPFDKAAMLARLNAERRIVVIDPVATAEGGAFGSGPELAARSAHEVEEDKQRAGDMLRVALQGASLGTADEIEAGGRALFGDRYDDALLNVNRRAILPPFEG